MATSPSLSRLLAEIHLRLRQEEFDAVKERLRVAKAEAPDHPAVLEAEGDLAFATRGFKKAEICYRQALDLDPANPTLEEKFATALIKVHEPEYLAHLPLDDDDPIWLRRVPPRKLWVSLVCAIIIPGLGQWYNGNLLAGGLVMMGWIFFFSYQVYNSITVVKQVLGTTPGSTFSDKVLATVQQSLNPLFLALLAALLVYSVVDTVLMVKRGQEQGKS